jgi:tRNA-Thr(GGU) m(6)t(6)A37 methyltransferase TsaA
MELKQRTFTIFQVGRVKREDGRVCLAIDEPYRPALKQLEYFGHVQVLWWLSGSEDDKSRQVLESTPPYGKDVPVTGVFASRWPQRPNPIALTTTQVLSVNHEEGTVDVGNIDAFDGTPILDLKPYFPVCDRVKSIKVPAWVAHWPEWMPEEGMGLAEGEEENM